MTDRAREPRFYIDHGMIHDRVTGKHVDTEPVEFGEGQVDGDLRQAVATALFDTFSTARLSEHPEQEAEYGGHADSFIGWLGTQGFVVVAAKRSASTY